jgi:hypothetical protein
MNKTVVYVGLGLLALYLLTRKKDILKSAEVKQTLPPPEIGQPVEKPTNPPVIQTLLPIENNIARDYNEELKTDLFSRGRNKSGLEGSSSWNINIPDDFFNIQK